MSDDSDDLMDAHAAIAKAVADEAKSVSETALQARAELDAAAKAAADADAEPEDDAKPARGKAKPVDKD